MFILPIIERRVQEFWNSFLQIVHVSAITTKDGKSIPM